MIRADLHDAHFLVHASVGCLRCIGCTSLILTNLTVATSGNHIVLKGHVLRVLHDGVAVTTLSCTEGLLFTIGYPIVMSLVLLMVLLEGVIERTVKPIELGNTSEIPRHLRIIIGRVIVSSSDRVDLLVQFGVDHGITPVVMSLLPVVLWLDRRIEINS